VLIEDGTIFIVYLSRGFVARYCHTSPPARLLSRNFDCILRHRAAAQSPPVVVGEAELLLVLEMKQAWGDPPAREAWSGRLVAGRT
jgi:hypothetical protein